MEMKSPSWIGLAGKRELLVLFVHLDVAAAGNAAGTHSACNNGRVGGHTAADGQDTLRSLHTRRCPRERSQDGRERPSRLLAFHASASSAVKTILPQAAPGEAASTLADRRCSL